MSDTLPAFPVIDSLQWAPPTQTDPVEISSKPVPLVIHADADNAGYANDVWDTPASSGSPRLNNWWPEATPPPRLLRLRSFWRLVPGTFTHLAPGTRFKKSWQYTHGVSTTDEQSISVEVGIEGGGLSAGLSATFSHSVTVSDEQTETTTFSVDPPAEGVRVWVLWDLMYELSVLDQHSGAIIPTGTYRGDVDFSNDDHYSGAYLNYAWTHLIISSGNLIPQDKVFPAA